ncbi:Protein-serine/threonine phosphatase [Psidium guajava]|nr:Protein-serine/threonine phosphatase [Psidium guajava]
MGAEAEVVRQQSVPALEVQYFTAARASTIEELVTISSPLAHPTVERVRVSEAISTDVPASQVEITSADNTPGAFPESIVPQFVPSIRSGSFSAIGPRRFMEDEHIRVDDLSTHLGSPYRFPKPSAFYGVFDGHGGAEASAFIRKNVVRLFFDDAKFPQSSEVDDLYLGEVENSLRKAFLLADHALADDASVSSSSGTTALTAFILGRLLMVANAGDCRAVLCRRGEAIDMSQDHKPIYPPERRRVEDLGGFVEDGYLNGVLSVTRALGDWDMKFSRGSPSPLISEPEFRQALLMEDDEFLIIGCDGIWDVMSSQHAVNVVRRGLRRHDDPEQSARDLVKEALRLNTSDNLTVIVVCFTPLDHREQPSPRPRRLRCCSLSADALCSLRNLLDGSGSH